MKKIILDTIGILLILGTLYLVYRLFGIFWGILILLFLAISSFFNEKHNPIVLYYKNYGRKKDE